MNEPLAHPDSPEGLSVRSRAASDDRKLIAIIYADMVGYSRLVAIDDANTLWQFSALRRDLIGPAVHDHAGQNHQRGRQLVPDCIWQHRECCPLCDHRATARAQLRRGILTG